MPKPWYKIGTLWATRHAALDHGDVVRETAAFAKSQDVAANTLRGYLAAVAFLNQLRTRGEIDQGQLTKLSNKQLKCIAVLQRVAHRGREHLGPLLEKTLGDRPYTRNELEAEEAKLRERDARAAAQQARSDPLANAHSYRMRAVAFRTDAFAAWDRSVATARRTQIAPGILKEMSPLAIDAGAIGSDGAHALRLAAETSAASQVRPRLGQFFVEALATARIFETVLLLAQSRADAETLAALVDRIPGCGVRVACLGPGRAINSVAHHGRTVRPDLAPAFFGAVLPPHRTVDEQGRAPSPIPRP